MKGYIYTMYAGADPGRGWTMTDPIFVPKPTLGACMPNVRRAVCPGDYIFVVSGRIPDVRPYVVGGFRVNAKIDALAAHQILPENRLRQLADGSVLGNIIVDERGAHHPLDHHANFEKRVENYVIGENPIYLETPKEVQKGREESIPVLRQLFDTSGDTMFDVIGRWRRLDSDQIDTLVDWLDGIKKQTK